MASLWLCVSWRVQCCGSNTRCALKAAFLAASHVSNMLLSDSLSMKTCPENASIHCVCRYNYSVDVMFLKRLTGQPAVMSIHSVSPCLILHYAFWKWENGFPKHAACNMHAFSDGPREKEGTGSDLAGNEKAGRRGCGQLPPTYLCNIQPSPQHSCSPHNLLLPTILLYAYDSHHYYPNGWSINV